MGDRIEVSGEEIEAYASQVNEVMENLMARKNEYHAAAIDLKTSWVGRASIIYPVWNDDMCAILEELAQKISDGITELERMVEQRNSIDACMSYALQSNNKTWSMLDGTCAMYLGNTIEPIRLDAIISDTVITDAVLEDLVLDN